MSACIAVLGATGVYGRHLVPRLTAAGYRVRALGRRPDTAAIAAACGAELAKADIFDEASLRTALVGCDVAINLATALPGPNPGGGYAKNDHLRRAGTPIWVRACRDAGVPRIVQQSIAMGAALRRLASRFGALSPVSRAASGRSPFLSYLADISSRRYANVLLGASRTGPTQGGIR